MMPFTAEKFGAAHASLIVVICGRHNHALDMAAHKVHYAEEVQFGDYYGS